MNFKYKKTALVILCALAAAILCVVAMLAFADDGARAATPTIEFTCADKGGRSGYDFCGGYVTVLVENAESITVTSSDNSPVEGTFKSGTPFDLQAGENYGVKSYSIVAQNGDITVRRDIKVAHFYLNGYTGLGGRHSITFPATCTRQAVEYRWMCCSMCGNPVVSQYPSGSLTGNAKGHNFVEKKVSDACGDDSETYTVKTCETCGYVEMNKEVSANKQLAHNWESKSKEATCDADGYSYEECTVCGVVRNWEVKTHKPTSDQLDAKMDFTNADHPCESYINWVATCTLCNHIEEINVFTRSIGHDWVNTPDSKQPTCTEGGKIIKKCTRCHETMEEVVSNPLGHDWKSWEYEPLTDCEKGQVRTRGCFRCDETQTETIHVEHDLHTTRKEPTCIEEGYEKTECTRCHKVIKNEVIQPLGNGEHTYGNTYYSNENGHWRVCTVCGQSEQVTAHAGHDDGNCMTAVLCDACKYMITPAERSHIYNPSTDYRQYDENGHWYVCTREGCEAKVEYHAHIARSDDNDCATPLRCLLCRYEIIPAAEHSWVAVQGSGTEAGHTRECTVCGKREFTEHVAGIEATCCSPAECEYCHTKFGSLNENNHSGGEELRDAVEATENSEGYSGNYYCLGCGKIKRQGTTLEKLPSHVHEYTAKEHDSLGHWNVCSKCGHEEPNSKSAHSFGAFVNDGNGSTHSRTCTVCGYKDTEVHEHSEETHDCTKAIVCTDCGAVIVDAMQHNFSGQVRAAEDGHYIACVNRNCNAEKKEEHVGGKATCASGAHCEICGEVYGNTDPDNHTGTQSVSGQKDASCTQDGYTGDIVCDDCGKTITKGSAIPAAHSYDQSKLHSDAQSHWHECVVCGQKTNIEKHTYSDYTVSADGHTHECTACGHSEFENHTPIAEDMNCATALTCSVCGYEIEGVREHTWGAWTDDGKGNHVAKCENANCSVTKSEAHKGGDATCTSPAVCEVCQAEYGKKNPENHANHDYIIENFKEATETEEGYSGDKVCSGCGALIEKGYPTPLKAPHTHDWIYQSDDEGHWRQCTICFAHETTGKIKHTYGSEYIASAAGHSVTCTVCGYEHHKEHVYSDDDHDCSTALLCAECGYELVEAKSHSFTGVYFSDGDSHWLKCTNEGCTKTSEKIAHTGGSATCSGRPICADCGAEYGSVDPDNHVNTSTEGEIIASCTKDGYTGDIVCDDCGKVITKGSVIAASHTYNPDVWTCDNDKHWHECTVCGAKLDESSHTFGAYTANENSHVRECTVCGQSQSGAHVPGQDDHNCTTSLVCTVCGYEIEKVGEHAWGAWTDNKDGTHVRKCTNSNCTAQETGAHNGGSATCTSPAVCEDCLAKYGDKDPDNHVNENYILKDQKQATSTEDGYTGDKYCADCNKLVEKGTVINKTEAPPTGDNGELSLFAILLGISAAGVLFTVLGMREYNRRKVNGTRQ